MQKEKFISGMNGHIVLSPRERERIIQRSVEREHWKTKSTICMEEMAELQQQISKQIRGYDDRYGLLEEMADVYISLKLLESIFNVTPEEMQNAYNADIGSPLGKTLWGLLLVVGVDLTTVKTHDQKGEFGRYE